MKTPLYKRPFKAEHSLESYSCRCMCGGCGSATCSCGCPQGPDQMSNRDNVRAQASVRLGSQEHHWEVNWLR